MDSYSPNLEWELVKNEPYANKLAVMKRQLFEKILSALDDLYRSDDPEELIKAYLHETYILLKKQLPNAAKGRLKKARRLIEQHGHFHLWPAFQQISLRLKEQLIRSGNFFQDIDKTTEWPLQLQQLRDQYNAQHQKVVLYQKRFQNLSSEGTIEQSDISTDVHPAIRTDLLQVAALNAFSRGASQLASKYNAALLSDLQKLDQRNKTIPERILSTTYNLLLDYLHLGAYEQLTEGLAQLRSLPDQKAFKKLPRIESRVFEWGFQLELNVYFRQRQWESGFDRLQALQKGIATHQSQLSAPAFASLHLLGGLMAFHCQNYATAVDLLQPLYQTMRPENAKDIYRHARYLHLLAHLQLAHFETAESLLNGVKRAFRQKAHIAELDLFERIAAIIKNPDDKKAILKAWLPSYEFDSGLERYLALSQWLKFYT